jgi:hypothetical protein
VRARLEILVEKLEEDLRRYRACMLIDPEFTGIRSYDKRLRARDIVCASTIQLTD